MDKFNKNEETRFRLLDRTKYVNDYRIETVEGKNGKQRKIAVYTGDWYFLSGEPNKIRIKLILAAVAAVLACACLAVMLMQYHVAHIWITVILPIGIAMFPALYLLMGVSELPFALKPMDRAGYYNSIIRASRSSVGMIAFVAAGEGAALIYRIKNNDWTFMRGEITTLVSFALMLVFLVAVIKLLYSIPIEEKGNENYSVSQKK